jgi:hypothetical protein
VARNGFTKENPRLTGLTERTFGVELELGFKSSTRRNAARVSFASIEGALVAAMTEAGLSVRSEHYNHTTRTYWKFVPDGSVLNGIELVSPILRGEAGFAEIEKVCAVLKRFNATIDESMGLHVHHGASDLEVTDIRVLARLVTRFRPILDGLISPSRRSNHYCCHYSDYELRQIDAITARANFFHLDRHHALNLAALGRHNTVEFRQHGGTFEPKKIAAWVMLTQGLVEKAKTGRGRKLGAGSVPATGDGFNNLMRAAGLRTCLPHGQKVAEAFAEKVAATVEYFRERAKKFGLVNLAERSEVRSRVSRLATARVAEATANSAPVVTISDSAETTPTGSAQ